MKVRCDKFVWSVRLVKTRSLAAEIIAKGKIRINDVQIKSSREVKLGDLIQYHRHSAIFSYRIVAITDKRVAASLVTNFIEDLTPSSESDKYINFQLEQRNFRLQNDGKPSKKNRRELDDFLKNNL